MTPIQCHPPNSKPRSKTQSEKRSRPHKSYPKLFLTHNFSSTRGLSNTPYRRVPPLT